MENNLKPNVHETFGLKDFSLFLRRTEAARESVLQRQREGLLRGGLPGKSPVMFLIDFFFFFLIGAMSSALTAGGAEGERLGSRAHILKPSRGNRHRSYN